MLGVNREPDDQHLDRAAALADPLRQRLYRMVVAAEGPVGRDEVAEAAAVGRSLAAYHLDQLAELGLVEVSFARRTGRSGPGAGRPAKLYSPTSAEVTVQIPPRNDTLLARLFATAIEDEPTGGARAALRSATRAEGAALGAEVGAADIESFLGRLEARGYAPIEGSDGIRLRNCPFHHLVEGHLELVCTLNCELLGAAVDSAEVPLVAELDPRPGQCCVVLRSAVERGEADPAQNGPES